MDYETVDAADFGKGLRGIGLNLLVRDIREQAGFLAGVFAMKAHRVSGDFAIMTYGSAVFQLHSDGSYARHPLYALLPESPPRGAGLELRLHDTDPDDATARAEAKGGHILRPPYDQTPHGLREAHILCPNGYCWVPSRPL